LLAQVEQAGIISQ